MKITTSPFRETSWPPVQFLADTLVGSLSNSCLKENAHPEYVVPKSIAATSNEFPAYQM